LLQTTADNTRPRRAVNARISRFVHAADSEVAAVTTKLVYGRAKINSNRMAALMSDERPANIIALNEQTAQG
jgi:hypothetical protein